MHTAGRARIARNVGALLLLAAFLCSDRPAAAEEAPTPAGPQFIVKFRSGTAGDRTALQAIQDQPGQSRIFADFAAALGGEIGTPIRIASVTSGRELVVAVDVAAITAAVVAGLRRRPDVVRVEPMTEADVPPVVPQNPTISVEFARDSTLATSIAEGWSKALDSDPEILGLKDDVARDTGVELLPHPPKTQPMLFTLDIAKLAAELGERLKMRPDVEYLQPVTLLQLQPLPQ